MPGCPGPSLIRALCEDPALAEIRVVMLTAHHDDEIGARMAKLGVREVLHKPIAPEDLEAAVLRALDG
jgi:DNA-binding NarL/FixJ family response regulator